MSGVEGAREVASLSEADEGAEVLTDKEDTFLEFVGRRRATPSVGDGVEDPSARKSVGSPREKAEEMGRSEREGAKTGPPVPMPALFLLLARSWTGIGAKASFVGFSDDCAL